MKNYFAFAGITLEIDIPDGDMFLNLRRLAPFRVDTADGAYRFTFSLAETLPPPEGTRIACVGDLQVYADGSRYIGLEQSPYMRVKPENGGYSAVLRKSQFSNGIGTHTVLRGIGVEHLLLCNNVVVLHSAFIEVDGKAILFTAPSGTGKSTQAELWHQFRGAKICNGDRAAIGMAQGRAMAWGIPFAGSSAYCEKAELPIAAIVYLHQASASRIRKLTGAAAFRRVWEGCSVNTWERQDLQMASTVVAEITQQVPVFELYCTPDVSAILALEEGMRL